MCTCRYIISICVFILDALIIVYNVTVSSFVTPADLSGFDITISWTVSNGSLVRHGKLYIHNYAYTFSVHDNSLSTVISVVILDVENILDNNHMVFA